MNRANVRRNGVSFDSRTTAEVDGDGKTARSMHNDKPYRSKADRVEARNYAARNERGFWTSTAPVKHHPAPKGG